MSERWSVTIPGAAPSTNHLYRIVYRAGHPAIAKAAGVEHWQTGVALLVRSARPSGWVPGASIRIIYDFFLNRHADCDNLQKALNDAIAIALGVDDDAFLPCARSKVTGVPKAQARIVVAISNADHEADEPALLGEGHPARSK